MSERARERAREPGKGGVRGKEKRREHYKARWKEKKRSERERGGESVKAPGKKESKSALTAGEVLKPLFISHPSLSLSVPSLERGR